MKITFIFLIMLMQTTNTSQDSSHANREKPTITIDNSSAFKIEFDTPTEIDTNKINNKTPNSFLQKADTFFFRHSNFLGTTMAAIIVTFIGGLIIKRRLINFEDFRSLNRNKYQWKYELLQLITKTGFYCVYHTIQYGKGLSDLGKLVYEKEQNNIPEPDPSYFVKYQSEMRLLSIQCKTIFKDKAIYDVLIRFIELQNASNIAKKIMETDEEEILEKMTPIIQEMQTPLDDAINRISEEIKGNFDEIERRAKLPRKSVGIKFFNG